MIKIKFRYFIIIILLLFIIYKSYFLLYNINTEYLNNLAEQSRYLLGHLFYPLYNKFINFAHKTSPDKIVIPEHIKDLEHHKQYNKNTINHFLNPNVSYFVVKQNNFYIYKTDRFLWSIMKKGRYWENYLHRYYETYKDSNGLALDIGAGMGTHSIPMTDYFGEVICYEPQAHLVQL